MRCCGCELMRGCFRVIFKLSGILCSILVSYSMFVWYRLTQSRLKELFVFRLSPRLSVLSIQLVKRFYSLDILIAEIPNCKYVLLIIYLQSTFVFVINLKKT